jgi:type IV pilus assembly protein PilN
MRITLNLASKPFIELRPLYARLRWWMAILLVAAIPLWLLLKSETRKAALANARLLSVQNSIQALEKQESDSKVYMGKAENAAVLTQAAFLNQVFARKGFSWTAIMMDLETVLPAGVQVLNIDPETDKAGNVTIRLRVSGQRDRAVELVRNLEHSRRFLQPRLASETAETTTTGNQANFQPASGTSNVNFDVLAGYNPLQPKSKEDEKTAKAEKHADSEGESNAPAPDSAEKSTPKKAAPKRSVPRPPLAPMAPARPAKAVQ